jgi:hypothetical protein
MDPDPISFPTSSPEERRQRVENCLRRLSAGQAENSLLLWAPVRVFCGLNTQVLAKEAFEFVADENENFLKVDELVTQDGELIFVEFGAEHESIVAVFHDCFADPLRAHHPSLKDWCRPRGTGSFHPGRGRGEVLPDASWKPYIRSAHWVPTIVVEVCAAVSTRH